MIGILVALLVLVVVLYVVKLVMDMIPLPEPIKQIAWIIIGLIALLHLLSMVGYAPVNIGYMPRYVG